MVACLFMLMALYTCADLDSALEQEDDEQHEQVVISLDGDDEEEC